jgi:hypothetical protein
MNDSSLQTYTMLDVVCSAVLLKHVYALQSICCQRVQLAGMIARPFLQDDNMHRAQIMPDARRF